MTDEEYKKQLLDDFEESFSQLLELHAAFTAYIPSRAKEAQDGIEFLGFDDDAILALLCTFIVLTRHLSAIHNLLVARYPVQAMVLLRPLIECWFYVLMYFENPKQAGEYFKQPTDSRGRPKYRPHEIKSIALRTIRDSPTPHANEFANLINDQYRLACEMVHLSNELMYASFGLFSGEDKIPISSSSENDKNLYIAFGRILHVSTAFWVVLSLTFLEKDHHPFTAQLSGYISDYVIPAFDRVGSVEDSEQFASLWTEARIKDNIGRP